MSGRSFCGRIQTEIQKKKKTNEVEVNNRLGKGRPMQRICIDFHCWYIVSSSNTLFSLRLPTFPPPYLPFVIFFQFKQNYNFIIYTKNISFIHSIIHRTICLLDCVDSPLFYSFFSLFWQ